MDCYKTSLLKKYFFFVMLLVLPATTPLFAQISLGNPTLPATMLCAGSVHNKFDVSFSFNPSALQTANQFSVEMSDSSGSFASPTVIYTSVAGAVTISPATFTFAIPNNTAGETYRIRIKSSAPQATSNPSKNLPAYYKIQDEQFSINNRAPTATFCNGSSYILTIDNPGTGGNDSPLKYPSLTYRWFKEPSLVPIATTPSLIVNQAGSYYVETNYGSCSPSDSYSNRVTVSEATSGTAVAITSSLGNPFCMATGKTTLMATQTGNSYQWFKDNVLLTGATDQQYATDQPGLYAVAINFGGCSATPTFDLKVIQTTSTINFPISSIIKEGETKEVIVTTDASSPTFEWFRNGISISNAMTNTYLVKEVGRYKVKIAPTSGSCLSTSEITFEMKAPSSNLDAVGIPNVLQAGDFWSLPDDYNNTNTEVLIFNSQGKLVFQTVNYNNDTWPEGNNEFGSVNPVYYYTITTQGNLIKKGSITVVK